MGGRHECWTLHFRQENKSRNWLNLVAIAAVDEVRGNHEQVSASQPDTCLTCCIVDLAASSMNWTDK